MFAALTIMRTTFSSTLGPVLWLYMAEIVSPSIVPLGAMSNWLAAGVISFAFPVMSFRLGSPGWMFIFNSVYTLASVLVNHFCLVESKDLNEIMIKKKYE
jgi:hypothetical protein